MISRQKAIWILLVLILLGVGIRYYELTARSLWFDEAFSWRLINFPLQEMIARDAADVHPPLYYITLRTWSTIFGSTLFALRSFSVIMAGAAIGAIYLFAASAWRSRATGLLAAALMAFSGWQISFAWEARMYTLGIFLSLVSSWLLIRAIRQRTQRPYPWVAYALITVAFAYIHYFSFFTIAAQVLVILIALIRQTKWRLMEVFQSRLMWYALLAGALMLIIYVPWIPTFLAQNQQVQTNYWVPPIGGWSIPDTFYRMILPTPSIPAHTGINFLTAIIPVTLTALLWLWLVVYGCFFNKQKREECDAAWLTALSAIVPFLLAILISTIGQSLYQDRFLVFTHAFTLIALAVAIRKLPGRFIKHSLSAVVLVGFLVASWLFWQELDIVNRKGARAATVYAVEQRTTDEPIIVGSPFVYFAAEYYTSEELNTNVDPALYSETGELIHFAGGPILAEEDLISPAELSAQSSNTIWLIDSTGFGGSEIVLSNEWKKTDTTTFEEVFVHQGQVIVNKYER